MLLYCYTVPLLCCSTVLLFYCYTVILFYCYTVILLYCYTVLLLYCYVVIQLSCYTVILLYCYTVMLCYRLIDCCFLSLLSWLTVSERVLKAFLLLPSLVPFSELSEVLTRRLLVTGASPKAAGRARNSADTPAEFPQN